MAEQGIGVNSGHPLTGMANRRIFENCLPHYPNCIDLYSLLSVEEQNLESWLKPLLNGTEATFNLETTYQQANALTHCWHEHQNTLSIKGLHSFSMGFPVLGFSTNENTWLAPLFIWKCTLNPPHPEREGWQLSNLALDAPSLNLSLARHLKLHFDYDLEAICQTHIAGNTFNEQAFAKIMVALGEAFGFDATPPQSWIALPTPAHLENFNATPELFWSAVCGLFPPPSWNVSSASLYEKLQPGEGPAIGHEEGLFPLDPFQSTAYQYWRTNATTLVQGGAGTGKTQLAAQALTNALSNGERCLVVADNIPSLKNIQSYLTRFGLNQLHFLLQDTISDRQLLIDIIRAAASGSDQNNLQHDELRFQQLIDKLQREWKSLNDPYQASRKSAFDQMSWMEAVGLFLKNNRKEGKELLSSQLLAADFTFEGEEYQEQLEAIDQSRPLYEQVNTLHHPLNNLANATFTEMHQEDAKIFITAETKRLLQKATRLHQRYITKSNAYSDRLFTNYEQSYQQLFEQLRHLRHLIAEGVNDYGDTFKTKTPSLKVKAIFSAQAKQQAEDRAAISQAYESLMQTFERIGYFEFEWLSIRECQNISKLEQLLDQFKEKLESWREQLIRIVQDDMRRLNHKTVAANTGFEDQIRELEESLDLLIEDCNRSGIYQEALENKTLTLPKRQKKLENIIDQIETTQFYLRDFESFFPWRRNWLRLSNGARKVVRALIKVKANDWTTAYKSWYLYHALSRVYDPVLPKKSFSLGAYVETNEQILPAFVPQIMALWQQEKREVLKDFRKQHKASYQSLFGKNPPASLDSISWEKLLQDSISPVTTLLPVLFMPASLATRLFSATEKIFDHLIIEDAHFLPLGDIQQLVPLAKKTLIVGNTAHAHSDSINILDFCAEKDLPIHRLKIIHSWSPGNMLQLNQATYIAEEAIKPYQINFDQIDGRYDEATQTNETEAQAVIHLLNQIEKTPQRTYPKVGIVCMTSGQRNLIITYLDRLKRDISAGAEKIRQLYRNGLGVYRIGELHGLQFNTLIISGTFGSKDVNNTLSGHIELFNQLNYLGALRLMMSRVQQEVYILNSIPADQLQLLHQNQHKPGTHLLATYFIYARALNEGDAKIQELIGEEIRLLDPPSPPSLQRLEGFFEEIALLIQPYLKPGRIHLNKQNAHYYFPLLIEGLHEQQPPVVISPDGYWSMQQLSSFQWEHDHERQLRNAGYHILPVWSELWWKSPEAQARKLASAINKLDQEWEKTA